MTKPKLKLQLQHSVGIGRQNYVLVFSLKKHYLKRINRKHKCMQAGQTSIHPSIVFRLSGPGSWGQQQSPDLPLPGNFLQFVQGNTEPFPGHPRDVISPVCPRPTPGSSPSRHVRIRFQIQEDSLGYLPRWFGHLTRMPITQMSKRLAPFDVEERLYSEPLSNNRIT